MRLADDFLDEKAVPIEARRGRSGRSEASGLWQRRKNEKYLNNFFKNFRKTKGGHFYFSENRTTDVSFKKKKKNFFKFKKAPSCAPSALRPLETSPPEPPS